MISPTGKGPRGADSQGSGAYGSPRGGRMHSGTDYICEPGQNVYAPISGLVVREALPYSAESFSGLIIMSPSMEIALFYMEPDKALIGTQVFEGQIIGEAQDITQKYPGITPHIHMQINSIDPEIIREGRTR